MRVKADIAPWEMPGGAAIYPADVATHVRMVAETVTLEVNPPSPTLPVEAWVTVDFTMRNMGDAPEQLVVGFPISCTQCLSYDDIGMEEINDLSIYVNTQLVATRLGSIDVPSFNVFPVNWRLFDVTFPSGQDVYVRVTYTAGSWAAYGSNFSTFKYILSTGAGWYDTIGSIDIIVKLPFPANELNVYFSPWESYGIINTIPPAISGNEYRWHLDDYEPVGDFELTIVHPWIWYTILLEEENVRINTQDGEAWGRLGLAIKRSIAMNKGEPRIDPGGVALYARAIEAYEQAVTLQPDDAMWHAGFADLLLDHYEWSWVHGSDVEDQDSDGLPELLRAVDEIRISLGLDPSNELALDLLDMVNSLFPGAITVSGGTIVSPLLTSTAGYPFLSHSPTDTPLPTRTPTPTIVPGSTVLVAAANRTQAALTETPTPASPTTNSAPIPPTTTPISTFEGTPPDIAPLWIALALMLLLIGLGWLLRRSNS